MIKTIILLIVLFLVFIVYVILSFMGVDVVGIIVNQLSFLKEGMNFLIVVAIILIVVVSLVLFKAGTSST